MVWAQVKHYAAMKNTTFRKVDVEKLIAESFEGPSADNWKNYVQHVMKVEEEMWQADNLLDDIEELILRLTSSSSSSSTSPSPFPFPPHASLSQKVILRPT
jgi:hypothetical protein